MNTNNELIDKLKEFLTQEEINEGIEKGVIKLDIEKADDKTVQRLPVTHVSSGLASGTGPINETTAGGASWEMVKTSIAKAIEAFEKATSDMSSYVEKAEYSEEQNSDMEKAYGKMMSSADQMKNVMKTYKGKHMNNMQKGDENGYANNKEDKEDKETMKSENKASFDRIEKAFNEKITQVSDRNSQLEKTNQALAEQNNQLQKSMETLNDTIGKLQEDINKIGSETPAPKAVNLQAYIEKGGVKDTDGKKIYHVGIHKAQIINELENIKGELDEVQKAQVEEDILNYATANMAPSEAVSRMLYDKKDVKLVK